RMGVTQRAIWASPAFLEKYGTPETPQDVAKLPCLIFRQSPVAREWTLSRGRETVTLNVDGRLLASSGEILLQGALDGVGLFYAADWLICQEVNEGRLVRVLPDWEGAPLPVHCVWTSGKLRGKAKLFADHMADALRFNSPICDEAKALMAAGTPRASA
ncbi:MAG: substrate binding domain-containing protein, partial [Hyphomonadaceae bacterium]|nr:substrate binding domain-containing protein [Hyphomonadaceae bacterium]